MSRRKARACADVPDLATHDAARARAQARADELGHDVGIEWCGWGWHVFSLPRPENRQGFELRCEVVTPSCGRIPAEST